MYSNWNIPNILEKLNNIEDIKNINIEFYNKKITTKFKINQIFLTDKYIKFTINYGNFLFFDDGVIKTNVSEIHEVDRLDKYWLKNFLKKRLPKFNDENYQVIKVCQ